MSSSAAHSANRESVTPDWIRLAAVRCAVREGRIPYRDVWPNHFPPPASSQSSTARPASQGTNGPQRAKADPQLVERFRRAASMRMVGQPIRLVIPNSDKSRGRLRIVSRYGGHDVTNQPRDEQGRWVEAGDGGKTGGKSANASHAATRAGGSRGSGTSSCTPGGAGHSDAEGEQLYAAYRELMENIPYPDRSPVLPEQVKLTDAQKRSFLNASREEQRNIVAFLKSRTDEERQRIERQRFYDALPSIGAASPQTTDVPLTPLPNAPFAERYRYYTQMRDLAFRTGNARFLVPPPQEAAPHVHDMHARDIADPTGDWGPWFASRTDRFNELGGAIGHFQGARTPIVTRPVVAREMAHGAPLVPLPGPNVTTLAGPPSSLGFGGSSPGAAFPPGDSRLPAPANQRKQLDNQPVPARSTAGLGNPPGATPSIPSGSGTPPKPAVQSMPRPEPPSTPVVERPPETPPLPPFSSARHSAISVAQQNSGLPQKGNGRARIQVIDPVTEELIGEQSLDGSQGWRIEGDHVRWWNYPNNANRGATREAKPLFAMAGRVPIQKSDSTANESEVLAQERASAGSGGGGGGGKSSSSSKTNSSGGRNSSTNTPHTPSGNNQKPPAPGSDVPEKPARTAVNERGETFYPDGATLKNWKGEDVKIPPNHTMSLLDPPMHAPPIIRGHGLADSRGFTDAERAGFLAGNDGGTMITPHHRHQIAVRDGGVLDELPRYGHPDDNVHLKKKEHRRHPNDGRNGRNRTVFEGQVGERLREAEVRQFFKNKGARLVRDPSTGLWLDPMAQ